MPDARTIRYYTTLGLIDQIGAPGPHRALRRAATLQQLVAIKRLQADGPAHAGPDGWPGLWRTSSALARVPAGRVPAAPAAPAPAARRDFWRGSGGRARSCRAAPAADQAAAAAVGAGARAR
ncbi:MAG: hypothetical protein KIT58_10825 [Planctomycetota bacterium]|nr:hypothetical protein [Planctomycetota bacterium]